MATQFDMTEESLDAVHLMEDESDAQAITVSRRNWTDRDGARYAINLQGKPLAIDSHADLKFVSKEVVGRVYECTYELAPNGRRFRRLCTAVARVCGELTESSPMTPPFNWAFEMKATVAPRTVVTECMRGPVVVMKDVFIPRSLCSYPERPATIEMEIVAFKYGLSKTHRHKNVPIKH